MLNQRPERSDVVKGYAESAGKRDIHGNDRNTVTKAVRSERLGVFLGVQRYGNDNHHVYNIVVDKFKYRQTAGIIRGIRLDFLKALEYQHFVFAAVVKQFC